MDSIAIEPDEVIPAIKCKKPIIVVGKPHVLRPDVIQMYTDEGALLSELLEGINPLAVTVKVNGQIVASKNWRLVRPRAGTTVEVYATPLGDTGKKIAGIVGLLALTVLTSGIASGVLLAGITGGIGFGATMLAAGVSVLGTMALSALLAPPTVTQVPPPGANSMYQLNGFANKSNPYGPVPLAIGSVRMYPTLAARPYSQMLGARQETFLLLDIGLGSVLVDQLQVGTTAISAFDVDTQVGTAPTLFSNSTDEQNVNTPLVGTGFGVDGQTWNGTSSTDADEISVDIAFPQGLFGILASNQATVDGRFFFDLSFNKTGDAPTISVTVNATYKPSPADQFADDRNGALTNDPYWGTWAAGALPKGMVRNAPGSRDPFVLSIRWKPADYASLMSGGVLPVAKQYDVRVVARAYGVQPPPSDDSIAYKVENAVVQILRSTAYTNPSTTNTTKLAIRINTATDVLSGNLNQINCRVQQQIRVWTGGYQATTPTDGTTGWVTPTSGDTLLTNPAWIFFWLLTTCPDTANPVDRLRIDFPSVNAWAATCVTLGLSFSAVIDSTMVFEDLLKAVCAAGLAKYILKDGKYGVLQDVSQTTPTQHFTPRNSTGFSGARSFLNPLHAIKCKFLNPNADWQQDEIVVYDAGYNLDGSSGLTAATNFESMELFGVTSATAAWRIAKYHLAVARLRQSEYSWKTDVENLVCQRGDLVKMNHDVTRWGDGNGRISRLTGYEANLCPYPSVLTSWLLVRATASTNQTVAPDGTSDADTLVEDGTASNHYAYFTESASSARVFSVYAKTAGRSWIHLDLGTTSTYFDIVAGVVGTVGSGITASIEYYGNGWWKCSVTSASTPASTFRAVTLATGDAADSYTGGSLWGVYIWKAELYPTALTYANQIELDDKIEFTSMVARTARIRSVTLAGASVSQTSAIKCKNLVNRSSVSFARSTTGTYMGPKGLLLTAAINVPRFEYSPEGKYLGLLIEESRTNYIAHSTDPTNAEFTRESWTGTITGNYGVAPDGTKTSTRLVYTGGYFYRATATGPAFTLSPGQIITVSCWVKGAPQTGRGIGIWSYAVGGVVAASSQAISAGAWALCSVTFTIPVGFTSGNLVLSGNPTNIFQGDIEIWGPQIEIGPTVSSYIPTTTVAVTRGADIATVAPSDIGVQASQGSIVAEFDTVGAYSTPHVFALDDGSVTNSLSVKVEPRTNKCLWSQMLSNAAWQKQTGVTVTDNYATAPDGTNTASRIQYDGTGTPGNARMYQGIDTPTVGSTRTTSVWLRVASGTFQVELITNLLGALSQIDPVLTTTWQRFSLTGIGSGYGFYLVYLRSIPSDNSIFDIQWWGAQAEEGSVATDYISSGSSPGRAGEGNVKEVGTTARYVPDVPPASAFALAQANVLQLIASAWGDVDQALSVNGGAVSTLKSATRNLVQNSSFEAGPGWVAYPTNWCAYTNIQAGTYGWGLTDSVAGVKNFMFYSDGVGINPAIHLTAKRPYFTVGQVVTLSASFKKATGGVQATLGWRFFSAETGGTDLGGAGTTFTTATGVWQRHSFTFTVATDGYYSPLLGLYNGGAAVPVTQVWWDCVQAEIRAAATPWMPAPEDMVNPAPTTFRIGTSQAGNYLNGHIKKLMYYPTRLTDTQLQQISSGALAIPDLYLWDLVTPLQSVAVEDLALVGQTGLESVNLIVTAITPGPDLSATIRAVDEAPGVYSAHTGSPDAFTSSISGVYIKDPPAAPVDVTTRTVTYPAIEGSHVWETIVPHQVIIQWRIPGSS